MMHVRGFDMAETVEATDMALAASMFAASVGMIWDLATGHVIAFEGRVSKLCDDDPANQT